MVSAIAKRTGLSLLAFMLVCVMYTSFVPIHSARAASAVTIDGASKFQTIDGFGFWAACLADRMVGNVSDSVAALLASAL